MFCRTCPSFCKAELAPSGCSAATWSRCLEERSRTLPCFGRSFRRLTENFGWLCLITPNQGICATGFQSVQLAGTKHVARVTSAIWGPGSGAPEGPGGGLLTSGIASSSIGIRPFEHSHLDTTSNPSRGKIIASRLIHTRISPTGVWGRWSPC